MKNTVTHLGYTATDSTVSPVLVVGPKPITKAWSSS